MLSTRTPTVSTITAILALSTMSCFATALSAEQGQQQSAHSNPLPRIALFDQVRPTDDGATVQLNQAVLEQVQALGNRPFIVEAVPLNSRESVDLQLRTFSVTNERSRFVLGNADGTDSPLTFDPSTVTLLRGHIAGEPGSHAFLTFSDNFSVGRIQRGLGQEMFLLSSRAGKPDPQAPQQLALYRPQSGAQEDDTPACAFDAMHQDPPEMLRDINQAPNGPRRGVRLLEWAIESDYAYFTRFGSIDAALTYTVQLMGAVSDIYIRDVDSRVLLTYVRLWNIPDVPFDSFIGNFQSYWNTNMDHVQRDIAELLSGRNDYPGNGFFNGFCTSSAYCVAGKLTGILPDPNTPDNFHWDLYVTAHEPGHNADSPHTHDYLPPIDRCGSAYVPQRGTIMSYCNRTNGGMANYNFYFHARTQALIEDYFDNSSCIGMDCNFNASDDDFDIVAGNSLDINGNNIPDECEDCNENGILDTFEINDGTSQDLNGNWIPDECESDCNANGWPDTQDIQSFRSLDENGNLTPDECEPDCNNNTIADHVEIDANMSLDLDRNAGLDACQDCDDDGIEDVQDLAGAHHLWLYSLSFDALGEYFSSNGVQMQYLEGNGVSAGGDLVIGGPSNHIFVSSAADNRVLEFDSNGATIGDFVSAGSGGLSGPADLLFGPSGNLLVSSVGTDSVLEYDGSTGDFVQAFVSAGSGGLSAPGGLTFGPAGNLLVGSTGTNEVLEYDGGSGEFVGVFVSAGSGGLSKPTSMTFKADGNLIVVSSDSSELLEYDGRSGNFFSLVSWSSDLNRPHTVRIGPSGEIFVSNRNTTDEFTGNCRVYEFEVDTGFWHRHSRVCGNDLDIDEMTGFDFMPGWDTDCNVNAVVDNCDISSGFSDDDNGNGIPDECELDCNDNGVNDRLDIIPFGSSEDCDFNSIPDECEVLGVDCNENGIHDACDIRRTASRDCDFNDVPDECEAFEDCNSNGENDACDITAGEADDCDNDWVPDECALQGSDCNENGLLDNCDIAEHRSGDCNDNGAPDECDIGDGTSEDCNDNGIPDECADQEPDCNDNGIPDSCDIANGTSEDCTGDGVPDDCEPDCNSNGSADSCDIASGTSNDCNGNGIPDECLEVELDCNDNSIPDSCDISGGTSTDCNQNGVPDDCIDHELDCNENGVPDACDVAAGTSTDCAYDGIPDECEEDCNENGEADSCDIADGTSVDCNRNGVPDECDLDGGSADCNDNNIPDECDVSPLLATTSPQLSPIGADDPQSFTLSVPPEAISDVTIQLTTRADLGSSQNLRVYINDNFFTKYFVITGLPCPDLPQTETHILDRAEFNDWVGGGDALVEVRTSSGVDSLACDPPSFVQVALTYRIDNDSDANGNGVPDECETCAGDVDGSGTVDFEDILLVLVDWGETESPADLNNDGIVDFADVLVVLSHWGPCEE